MQTIARWRVVLARFLIAAGAAYAGLAIYYTLSESYTVTAVTGLTASILLLVARMVTAGGRPSVLLTCTFLAAMFGVNILLWTVVR